jgi:hypothetical protein
VPVRLHYLQLVKLKKPAKGPVTGLSLDSKRALAVRHPASDAGKSNMQMSVLYSELLEVLAALHEPAVDALESPLGLVLAETALAFSKPFLIAYPAGFNH